MRERDASPCPKRPSPPQSPFPPVDHLIPDFVRFPLFVVPSVDTINGEPVKMGGLPVKTWFSIASVCSSHPSNLGTSLLLLPFYPSQGGGVCVCVCVGGSRVHIRGKRCDATVSCSCSWDLRLFGCIHGSCVLILPPPPPPHSLDRRLVMASVKSQHTNTPLHLGDKIA